LEELRQAGRLDAPVGGDIWQGLGRAQLVLGRGGSTSRTIRSISRIAPRWNCDASIGGDPVSNS